MTVQQLLGAMPASELAEWRAFLEIERSGGLTQETLDLDAKLKAVFASITK